MLKCFIGGIYGTISVGTVTAPVLIDPQGQLGTIGPLTNGQLVIGSTGASPVAATLTPGSGIVIDNSAGGIVISTSPIWGTVSTGSFTATTNHAYIVTSGAVTIGLPTISSLGDQLIVALRGGTQVGILQAAGQTIYYGDLFTTTGVAGSLTSTKDGDSITLISVAPSSQWLAIASMGNWMIA